MNKRFLSVWIMSSLGCAYTMAGSKNPLISAVSAALFGLAVAWTDKKTQELSK